MLCNTESRCPPQSTTTTTAQIHTSRGFKKVYLAFTANESPHSLNGHYHLDNKNRYNKKMASLPSYFENHQMINFFGVSGAEWISFWISIKLKWSATFEDVFFFVWRADNYFGLSARGHHVVIWTIVVLGHENPRPDLPVSKKSYKLEYSSTPKSPKSI